MSEASVKAVILAGGLGTRLAEETEIRPKPMVEIGGYPILWHIMKIYSFHGINDFVVCLGYKGRVIREFFANYAQHLSDITFDYREDSVVIHQRKVEPWRITLVETGESTMTGGRMKRIRQYVEDGPFCFTYGDGVADIDIRKLIAFHRQHGRLVTVTSVLPPGRYGVLEIEGAQVNKFVEKPHGEAGWINGGFFVVEPKAIDYIDAEDTIWEQEPMRRLAANGQLTAYKHDGFWQAMDTLRDKQHLQSLWDAGRAPWRVW
jgi:glucose-1-phosphate cytidylyltransferase